MTAITIELPETIARQVKSMAVEQHTTVSTVVSAIVVEHVKQQKGYLAAQEDFLSRQPVLLQSDYNEYPRRDALYDRADIR
jgi:predicted transcriptional regulator